MERLAERRDRDPADTALRLVKALGTSPELWLNLPTDYDVQGRKTLDRQGAVENRARERKLPDTSGYCSPPRGSLRRC